MFSLVALRKLWLVCSNYLFYHISTPTLLSFTKFDNYNAPHVMRTFGSVSHFMRNRRSCVNQN